MTKLVLILSCAFILNGCASFKGLMDEIKGNHLDQPKANEPIVRIKKPKAIKKYSDIDNYNSAPEREYKRMTRRKMTEEARLQQNSGSLWQEQGQSGYLFTENPLKLIGDRVGVELEGDPKEQLEEKVGTIKTLLAKLEERKDKVRQKITMNRRERREKIAQDRDPASKSKGKVTSSNTDTDTVVPADLEFKKVFTRITEQLPDGNYRVKGSKPLMISKREYRVIIDGIAKPDDLVDGNISADKLIDAQFDVVSTRRKGSAVWQ